MKLAVSGKGGVGKTTFAAVLARILAQDGRAVIAIDADPAANLAASLGIKLEKPVVPLSQMYDLIRERTGASPDEPGVFFKLNPRVDDLPEKFSILHEGVRLMVLGAISRGGGGCACSASALLRALMTHLVLQRKEVLIADMEAGIEHLGRATVSAVDALIVLVEPGLRSIETALQVRKLAREIGIRRILFVGNKVRDERQLDFLRRNLDTNSLLGVISYSPKVEEADMRGVSPFDACPELVAEVQKIRTRLEEILSQDSVTVKRRKGAAIQGV